MTRIARLVAAPYRLRLRRPWLAPGLRMEWRQGWIVTVATDGGLAGHGDCAPLPPLGTEQPWAARAALEAAAARLVGRDLDGALDDLDMAGMPAARAAVETALLDLRARGRGVPLAELLGAGPAEEVAVNAACGALGTRSEHRARAAAARGFRVLKLKVGGRALSADVEQLRRLARALPDDSLLRLDANGAWGLAEAEAFLDAVADLPIDHVEEPLRRADAASLARLQARVPFDLALDESMTALGFRTLLDERPVRRLVLKPTLLGGPSRCLALARRAKDAGLGCIVTSALETTVGVVAAAHLALAVAAQATHGLATLEWLAEDVAQAPAVAAGRLRLPAGPGLGLSPTMAEAA